MKQEREEILVINRGGGDNLGDRVINYTLTNLLASKKAKVHFADFIEGYMSVDFSKDLVSNENRQKNKKSLISTAKKITPSVIKDNYLPIDFSKRPVKQFDIAIIGGGQLINANRKFPMAMYKWCKHLKKEGIAKKVVLLGVGSVSSFSKRELRYYKKAFRYVDDFFIRDYESMETLKDKFNVESTYIPDVAFSLKEITEADDQFKEIDSGLSEVESILVGPTTSKRFNKYGKDVDEESNLQYWEEIILNHSEKGKVELFYTTKEDYQVSLALQEYLKGRNIDVAIRDCSNMYKMISVIKNAKMIISPRMHALIVGKNYNTEIIPIKISKKIESFDDLYGTADFSRREASRLIDEGINKVLVKVKK